MSSHTVSAEKLIDSSFRPSFKNFSITKKAWIFLALPVIFTFLFYNQSIGLNLFIFETLVLSALLIRKDVWLNNKNSIAVFAGTFLSAAFVVINYSWTAILANFLSFYILIGLLIYPETRSLINSLRLSNFNFFRSQIHFLKRVGQVKISRFSTKSLLRKIQLVFIPLVVIVFFVFLYKTSNSAFENYLGVVGDAISNAFSRFFEMLDFQLVVLYLLGLGICAFTFIKVRSQNIIDFDANTDENLRRMKKLRKANPFFGTPTTTFNPNALKNELTSAIFLLAVLNVLIFLVNALDIYHVWFNFEFNQQDLKRFVHEGTYLLILSIMISIGITLFYFRGNLNFFKNNRLLLMLSYAWLFQNVILTFSVAVRNFWYIEYYALAYKRIGVLVFLALTLYGIFTVIQKIRQKKNTAYLLRANSFALYIALVSVSAFDWDTIIAKYNFNNFKNSYVDLLFLSDFADKALPYLDKSDGKLAEIEKVQTEKFHFVHRYMQYDDYQNIIQHRKKIFKKEWEAKGILSWNLPESVAYEKLKNK
ncbi:MAG: DUF4173 domain-containing protein [Bacteroidota bacterium]